MPRPKPRGWIGVDPGISGGLALITRTGKVEASRMPKDNEGILEWFRDAVAYYSVKACIEQVHSMPRQGVKSTFTFGKGFGGLLMAMDSCGIVYTLVRPHPWQKALNLRTKKKGEDKRDYKKYLVTMAQRKFPRCGLDARTADAALIAEYCRTNQ